MNGKFVFRLIAALVMVAAIAGIAWFAFNAGVAQGSPITIQAPEGQVAPAPYPYYGWGMPFHPFWFGFGCFGIFFMIAFFVIAMKAYRFAVWNSRGGHHAHGPWRHDWGENRVPPFFEEWHKRAHEVPVGGGEAPAEEKKE